MYSSCINDLVYIVVFGLRLLNMHISTMVV